MPLVSSTTATSANNTTWLLPGPSSSLHALWDGFRQTYPHIAQGNPNVWEMVQIVALCSLLPGIFYLRRGRKDSKTFSLASTVVSSQGTSAEHESPDSNGRTVFLAMGYMTNGVDVDAESSDPGLLKKHSEFKTYTTSRYTYPKLRVFYRRHPQADKLPIKPAPLPLLVFIHGLGGSVAQFHPLLTSLVNLAPCLSVDLPGCGTSALEPKNWAAYQTDALVELLDTIIEDYRDKDNGQGVVLIGHSMGASFATQLASTSSLRRSTICEHVVGLVAVCPKADPPSEQDTSLFKKLLYIPGPIFSAWRSWDRRGGIESKSVHRFVGADSDEETKKLQFRFNEQSRTPAWRRMASGSLPVYEHGIANGGLAGRDIWAGLEVPVFLVAGEADNVTKPGELEKIAVALGKSHPVQIQLDEESQPIVDSAAPIDTEAVSENTSQGRVDFESDCIQVDSTMTEGDPSTPTGELSTIPSLPIRPKKVLKTTILPAPASHALLYQPATVRILAGLISDFLCSQVSPRLSLGWQLQFLSTAGKWDVKNLAKWQAVNPVSEPIGGVFRAMKTLREVDEKHCPEVFVREWGNQIKDIVDISHESPVYDPRGLERGGTQYHKFPTVSKIPPTGKLDLHASHQRQR